MEKVQALGVGVGLLASPIVLSVLGFVLDLLDENLSHSHVCPGLKTSALVSVLW